MNSELEKHKKSPGLAYVLWFFLGTLGVHKFYIGKTKMEIVYLILGVGGLISLLSGIIFAGATMTHTEKIFDAGLVGIGIGLLILMITPQSAKAKGKLLEDYIARRIRQLGLDRLAMRQPGSGSGQWKGDVNTKTKVLGRQL